MAEHAEGRWCARCQQERPAAAFVHHDVICTECRQAERLAWLARCWA